MVYDFKLQIKYAPLYIRGEKGQNLSLEKQVFLLLLHFLCKEMEMRRGLIGLGVYRLLRWFRELSLVYGIPVFRAVGIPEFRRGRGGYLTSGSGEPMSEYNSNDLLRCTDAKDEQCRLLIGGIRRKRRLWRAVSEFNSNDLLRCTDAINKEKQKAIMRVAFCRDAVRILSHGRDDACCERCLTMCIFPQAVKWRHSGHRHR